jgi:SH3-like domain-containing protein
MGRTRWLLAGGATVVLAALAIPGISERAERHGLVAPAAPDQAALAAAGAEGGQVVPAALALSATPDRVRATEAAVAPGSTSTTALPSDPLPDPGRGAVTNLPLPRFVSLKTGEGNARRGPGLTHRIDWVFTRAGMPLRITAEFEHWRRVEDAEGAGGWVHYSLLSGVRTATVTEDMVEFRSRPDPEAEVSFQAELGVMTRLLECRDGWCRAAVDGQKGWVRATSLWGVGADERLE